MSVKMNPDLPYITHGKIFLCLGFIEADLNGAGKSHGFPKQASINENISFNQQTVHSVEPSTKFDDSINFDGQTNGNVYPNASFLSIILVNPCHFH